ncbi:microtubule-associated tumor suppressor candidate 2 [Pholidichthys leucotaenia]
MCDQGESFGEEELENNNADGDANANDIRAEDGGRTGDTGSLLGLITETAEQDKVIIWGTDSQCDDPELAEFEMLECQELEAYLVEEEEDFVGLAARKELQDQPSSCRNAAAEEVSGDKSREKRKSIQRSDGDQESTVSHVSVSREASRTELSSETDVFVTCLSTVSSTGHASRTQMTDFGPHFAIFEDLTSHTISERGKISQIVNPSPLAGRSTIQMKDVDMNLNSKGQSEEAQIDSGVICNNVSEKHMKNNNYRNKTSNTIWKVEHPEHKATKSHGEINTKMDKSTQADESPDLDYWPARTGTKGTQPSSEPKAVKKQGSFDNMLKKQNSFDRGSQKQNSFENTFRKQRSFDNSLKKQGSFENTANSISSSLERRRPWGSPSRPAAPASPKTTSCSPKRRPPGSPAKVQGIRALSLERGDSLYRGTNQAVKPPLKPSLSSGIPKPVMSQQKEPEPRRLSPPQKPKNIRPKIITYVRKSPQAKPQVTDVAQLEASAHPGRLSSYTSSPAHNDPKAASQPKSTAVLSSSYSSLLFDKYRQEMQKTGYCPASAAATGVKAQNNTYLQRGGRSGSFHDEMSEKCLQEHVSHEGTSVYRSPRTLRPQLGLGAVTRQPAAKTRVQQAGQRAAPALCMTGRSTTAGHQDLAGEQKRSGPETTPKSVLLKSGQSGLRPPGFSALPPARLAVLGFVRSSSVSSVSSNQSNDSSHSDPGRPAQYPSSGSDDTSIHRAGDASPAHGCPQPPKAPSLQCRSVPPQHCSPLASRRELQKDSEPTLLPKSSPKRLPVVSLKPQSSARGAAQTDRAQELDRALIQQLRERCEQQDRQLQSLQAQLKQASLCLDVFSITTQHFYHKSESAIVKERELSLELARIRDEVAFSVAHWEQLQREKEELEHRFEAELQGLRAQQQKELRAVEERLKAEHMEETEGLQAQQRAELKELHFKQQERLEEMSENHEASLMEMESAHNDTLATLQEEHARTVKNLKMAHEQQRKSLEEEFEKIRLSLQDQVDTLTFQNRSLRDRAKRFEEALRKSTDEQIVDALAPYKHIEEDLKSLKEVLEMKNQQIHQQELKITELEKIAEKNVYLEERLQVLQQQNEDLKERIDKNLAVSRQLSEENANLQVHVEKESNEKKRLSRTNEELLWRLQTGELSPRMSPSSSPIHQPSSGSGSPARPHSYHQ